jgi:hypothetical protein
MVAQNTECYILNTLRKSVLDVMFDAIRKEQFYILPDPEWAEVVQSNGQTARARESPQQ